MDRRLTSKIYKQPMKLNISKTNNPINSWAEDVNKYCSKEDIQTANKHMKRCSTLFIIEKCKSKLQWLITSHKSEWPSSKIYKQWIWRGCGDNGTLLHCWWEYTLIQPLLRRVCRFLKKLRIKLLYDWTIPATRETQQFHYWAYILRKPYLKKTHIPHCSLQHYLQ